ncbi:MAG TPA: penicillin-binding protein 2 [Dongiaceae bacterium]|jgi:penicillin-binding protein 2|nr:penicillin-binding protein 2 [Dongiaceae bacterium]
MGRIKQQQQQSQQKVFTRRLAILGALKIAMVSALAGRLYYLQVIEGEKYKLLSDENRINHRILFPPRGLIVDRFGIPLATNSPSYRATLVAEQTPNTPATLEAFSSIVPLSERDIARALRERQRTQEFKPITVKDDLTWDDVNAVELNLPDLPGISIEIDQKRVYPFGGITSHILGYVAGPNEKDVENDTDPLLRQPGFHIGKNGLERQYDLPLRGTAGESQLEVNSFGRVIRELARQEGDPGGDLVTTLDVGLQQFAHQRLSSEMAGAAVVMDVYTGDLLALASTPSYDPTAFYRGLTIDEWQELSNDIYGPLTNKAVAGQYAPGSTFKMMTALAALRAGISPDDHVFCSGVTVLGSARFHCWKREGHGSQDMVNGIKNSCDGYFYEIARRVGIDKIAETARMFGLGSAEGLDLPGEKPGLIPDSAWKKAVIGDSWHPGETLVAGIGQGFITATPLQLCVMAARIANGGYAVKPRLVRRIADGSQNDEGNPVFPSLEVPENLLKILRTGMDMVTNGDHGTAYRSRIDIPGMEMAGKTGTSQVRRITMAERARGVIKNQDLPWNQRDHALFVAFAPVHAPRYAASVVVEHGGGGSAVAAPIARDILIECQRRDPSRRNPNAEGGRREMP